VGWKYDTALLMEGWRWGQVCWWQGVEMEAGMPAEGVVEVMRLETPTRTHNKSLHKDTATQIHTL
jgi:hypothetical protein